MAEFGSLLANLYGSSNLTVVIILQTLGSALKLPILSLTAAAQLLTAGTAPFLSACHCHTGSTHNCMSHSASFTTRLHPFVVERHGVRAHL